MKYVIVYWTRHGNNKRIVDYLVGKLGTDALVFKTDEVDPAALPDAEYYIFSAAAEAFRVQKNMRKFMKDIQGLEGKKYGIINTHAMESKNWLNKMEKMLSKKKMVKAAEVDFHMKGEVENAGGLQEGWEAKLDAFIGKLQ